VVGQRKGPVGKMPHQSMVLKIPWGSKGLERKRDRCLDLTLPQSMIVDKSLDGMEKQRDFRNNEKSKEHFNMS
jgi:hypothetical protein